MTQQRLRIVVPTTHDDAVHTIEAIEQEACAVVGGYSEYEGAGGWVDDSNERIEEQHTVIEVTDTSGDVDMINFARWAAGEVKDQLGEDAVLCTVEDVNAVLF